MNAFREYRLENNLTLAETVDEIRRELPDSRMTIALLSNIENGIVDASMELKAWLLNKGFKALPKLTPTELLVLDELENTDAEHPLTRRRLRELTHKTDRFNRLIIGKLRDHGNWIIGSDEYGYYITTDLAELEAWSNKYLSYARTIFRRYYRMKNKPIEGQVRM